jgi:hypothetical protein
MNTDIRLKTSFRDHRKRKKLQLRLGAEGVLAFIDLMLMAAETRPNGVLSGMDELDIALDANWRGAPEELVSALVDCGLLEKSVDGEYSIHDWIDHNAYAAAAEERSNSARKAAQARWGKRRVESGNAESVRSACGPHKSALPCAQTSNAPSPTPIPNREEKDSKNTPPYTPPGGGEVQDLSESPPPEQKPKTAKKKKQKPKPAYSEAFEFFWSEYPLKVGKGKAWESWENLDIDDQRAAYRSIKAQVQAQQFRNVDGVDNPPHPSTWLNQRRFEDSPRSPTPAVNSRSSPGCGPVYGGMKVTTVHQGLAVQNDLWARELLASREVESNGSDTRSGAEEFDKSQRALSGQGIE